MSCSALALAALLTAAIATVFGQENGTNDAMRRTLAVAPGIPELSAPTSYTREPIPRGTLTGKVMDTNGRRVCGATIRVIGGYIRDEFFSNENGVFTIPSVGAGKCDIEISSPYHYTSIVRGCIVAGDSTTALDIRLTRKSRGHMGDVLHRAPLPGEKMGTIRSTVFDGGGRPYPNISGRVIHTE